jgi:crotonobetainyl-CoA:carnitine CoA-transferase CaiB-like acyl-CoA transferase
MSDADWHGLTRALGHPEWRDDPRFGSVARRERFADERLKLTAEVLATGTSAEWLARLGAEDVPCAPVLRREDLLSDPQIMANGLIVESEHPHAGRMRQARPAARFEKTPAGFRQPAPLLGEHTDEILKELGLSGAELAELRASGVVG